MNILQTIVWPFCVPPQAVMRRVVKQRFHVGAAQFFWMMLLTTSIAYSHSGPPTPESPELLARYSAITMLAPRYPYDVRIRHLDARGVVDVTIDLTGTVVKAVMKKSTGNAALDEATIGATRRWRFQPGWKRRIDVPIHFSIKGTTFE